MRYVCAALLLLGCQRSVVSQAPRDLAANPIPLTDLASPSPTAAAPARPRDIREVCLAIDAGQQHPRNIEGQLNRLAAEHTALSAIALTEKIEDKGVVSSLGMPSLLPVDLDILCVLEKRSKPMLTGSDFKPHQNFSALLGMAGLTSGKVTAVRRAIDGTNITIKMTGGYMSVITRRAIEVKVGKEIEAIGYVSLWQRGLAQFPAIAAVAVLDAGGAQKLVEAYGRPPSAPSAAPVPQPAR